MNMRHVRSRAFTLVEAVGCMVVVAVLLVASLRASGTAAVYHAGMSNRAGAGSLADGLMNEILALSYQEPAGTPVFGCDSGETSNSKVNYDDVDDFHGWVETPPQDRDGTAISNFSGWKRAVTVEWVNASTPTTPATSETGLKRITVRVSRNNRVLCTRTAFCTNAP